jgi:hypothetical protein
MPTAKVDLYVDAKAGVEIFKLHNIILQGTSPQ